MDYTIERIGITRPGSVLSGCRHRQMKILALKHSGGYRCA